MKQEHENSGHRIFSLQRIAAITSVTFIGLIRQKAFCVLLLFGLILIGTSIFMARLSFQQEIQILKDVSLGAISIFTSLLAIVATARLLPQDLEERTIYAILAKPVPRFEYLVAKLAGVLLLLAVSMLVMSAMFFTVLFIREQSLLSETARQMAGASGEQIAEALRTVRLSAFNDNLLPGLVIIYFKAALLASLTLLVSTFASSNLFTIAVMVFVYFIGHLQATAREYWLQENAAGSMGGIFLALVALFFPDLQLFNLVDDIVVGTAIPFTLFVKTALLGCSYIMIYLLLAAAVFYGKEL